MASDIILGDNDVRVVDGVLRVDGAIFVGDRRDFVVQTGGERVRVQIGGHKPAHLQLPDRDSFLWVNGTVRCLEANPRRLDTREAHVGPSGGGEEDRSGGTITVANGRGREVVRIDGDRGDIVVSAVGSLVDKIGELERRIAALER